MLDCCFPRVAAAARLDTQVKIHGQRVEIEGLEAVLSSAPAVGQVIAQIGAAVVHPILRHELSSSCWAVHSVRCSTRARQFMRLSPRGRARPWERPSGYKSTASTARSLTYISMLSSFSSFVPMIFQQPHRWVPWVFLLFQVAAIRAHMDGKVPKYCLPQGVEVYDQPAGFPTTTSGKMDRRAILEWLKARLTEEQSVTPHEITA